MILPALALVPVLVAPQPRPPAEAAVARVLDDWHLAAAQADEARYFGHLAEAAVFLGTDASERWDKASFRAFAHPFFAKGKAWSFRAVRRTISFAAGGAVAYFDEDLDTPTMGPCRGSGVLEAGPGGWRILQYNLTVPIPNALMREISGRIGAHLKAARP
jgi:hypothetical protein